METQELTTVRAAAEETCPKCDQDVQDSNLCDGKGHRLCPDCGTRLEGTGKIVATGWDQLKAKP